MNWYLIIMIGGIIWVWDVKFIHPESMSYQMQFYFISHIERSNINILKISGWLLSFHPFPLLHPPQTHHQHTINSKTHLQVSNILRLIKYHFIFVSLTIHSLIYQKRARHCCGGHSPHLFKVTFEEYLKLCLFLIDFPKFTSSLLEMDQREWKLKKWEKSFFCSLAFW